MFFERFVRYEVDSEFCSSFVDADGMADHLGTGPGGLETWNTVDSVEKTQESHTTHRATKCLSKGLHVSVELDRFLSVLVGLARLPGLLVTETLHVLESLVM